MPSPLAVITGTSSGIGKAIAAELLSLQWRVVGISRRPGCFENPKYSHFQADLTDTESLLVLAQKISKTHGPAHALINNAGIGYFAPHEELSHKHITEMVTLNLLAPLLISRAFLRDLKETQGHIISISSFSALESSSFGAAYAATKAGLKHFSDSLFDEVRKSGVKVSTITPDITRTNFYDHLNFSPASDETAAITPECIAQVVSQILSQRPGTITTHVVLRPERLLLNKRKHTK